MSSVACQRRTVIEGLESGSASVLYTFLTSTLTFLVETRSKSSSSLLPPFLLPRSPLFSRTFPVQDTRGEWVRGRVSCVIVQCNEVFVKREDQHQKPITWQTKERERDE